ncbi:MAG: PKD domain-containing protein [Thermoplasmatota archaeon]
MKFLVAVLLCTLALAGCVSEEPTDASTSQSSSESGDVGGNQTTNETTNTPPQVSVALNQSMDDPWLVHFEINASDPDGDFLFWSLDADGDGSPEGDGSEFPATISHQYEAAGTYNISVLVDDGAAGTYANTTLTLEAKIVPPAYTEQLVITGTSQAACPQCTAAGANTGAGYRAGESGVDSVFAEVPGVYAGAPFTATSNGNIDLVFRDSCDAGAAVGEPFAADGDESGKVPAGAACVLMWTPDTPGATLTITIG